jgi:phosphomannomutase
VIYPELHYGRDSVAGISLILNEFADSGEKVSQYKNSLPQYYISKIKLENVKDPDKVLKAFEKKYSNDKDVVKIWTNDGLKTDFKDYWVHMRKSNTEPIIRVIIEAKTKDEAEVLQRKLSKSDHI